MLTKRSAHEYRTHNVDKKLKRSLSLNDITESPTTTVTMIDHIKDKSKGPSYSHRSSSITHIEPDRLKRYPGLRRFSISDGVSSFSFEPQVPHILFDDRLNFFDALHRHHPNKMLIGDQQLEVAVSYTQLGCIQYEMKRYEQAYEKHHSALQSRFKHLNFSHNLVSESFVYCAESLCALGRSGEGIPLAMHAVERLKAEFGLSHPALARAISVLACCYHKSGRSHDSLSLWKQCLDIYETAYRKNHATMIVPLINFGDALRTSRDYYKAKEAFKKAKMIHENKFKMGENASQLKKCQSEIEDLEQLIKKSDDNNISQSQQHSVECHLLKIPPIDETSGTPIIVLTDIGRDMDDELSLVLLASLKRKKLLNPIAVITTLSPSEERSWLARGTLDSLGLSNVPIGVGSPGGMEDGRILEFYGGSYVSPSHSIAKNGVDLMVRALEASPQPKSVQLLCIASLTDAATLLKNHEKLFVDKVKQVVVMGGLEPLQDGDNVFVKPDSAYNNNCDKAAAKYVYEMCQKLCVPTQTLSRWTAYGAAVPTSFLNNIATTEHMVATNVREVSESNLMKLWGKVRLPLSDPRREKLPARCQKNWFFQTFVGRDDVTEDEEDRIWDLVEKLNVYDPLAMLSCVPHLRERHFKKTTKMVNGTPHVLIGASKEETDVVDVKALHDDLLELLNDAFNGALLRGL